jgi:hypothetical protein
MYALKLFCKTSNRKVEIEVKLTKTLVFNATFNTISVISWRSVLLVEETGGPGKQVPLNEMMN